MILGYPDFIKLFKVSINSLIPSNKLTKSSVNAFFSLSSLPFFFLILEELVEEINNLFFNSSSSFGINLILSPF